ncbi:MAG: Gfo/Idh/MocA family protein [Alphaproteobacteria bacterium]
MFIKIKSERPVRVAVVGAGFFGGLHAAKYAANPDANLVAVVDVDGDRARAAAGKHGCRAETDLAAVLNEVDAVTVASPARTHYRIARQVLDAGVHCLVEKPLALDAGHAGELVRLAQRKGLVLQVGHQERYVFAQFGVLSRQQAPRFVECRRAGPFTGRAMDVSVVMDLMIHDIDLVHRVAEGEVADVSADAKFIHGDLADEVSAELDLACGTSGHLFASRNAPAKERSMRLIYDDGEIFIDFVNRTLTNTTPFPLEEAFGGEQNGLPAIATDPLGYGIGRFLECVQRGEEPVVTGAHAAQAVDTALRITRAHGLAPQTARELMTA